VQVEPMKPMLKTPGSIDLKLTYDGPRSNFAFNFNLRRYTAGYDVDLIELTCLKPFDLDTVKAGGVLENAALTSGGP